MKADRNRFTGLVAACLGAAAVATGLIGQAEALSPVSEPATIVYSNGGRLVSIKADGTGREVLTNRGKVRIPGSFRTQGTDRFPSVSPDGEKVLFTRNRVAASENEFTLGGDNMVLDLATGKLRKVLPDRGPVSYSNLAWIPGTSRVLASKENYRKNPRHSVVSVRLDGTGERKVLAFKLPHNRRSPRLEAVRLAVSPVGGKFLMTVMDDWTEGGNALELVDLATGKRRQIADGAHSGAWAPDGQSIVFVKDQTGPDICGWEFACSPSGDLFTANAAGRGIRRLTDTRRSEVSPSFSPDGSRIAFSATTSRPTDQATYELLSIGTDGKCAASLTNGSPASLDPAFVPGSGDVASPGGCGLLDRPALAEGQLNPVEKRGFGKRLWAGPESSEGLLSTDFDLVFLTFSIYGDCTGLRPDSCGPGATLVSSPVCFDQGRWAGMLAKLARSDRKVRKRGVWIDQGRRRGRIITTVYSGRRTTMIEGAFGPEAEGARKLSPRRQMAMVDELRVEGTRPGKTLPTLRIPRLDFKMARATTKLVERSSIPEVMREIDVSRDWVVDQLNFKRNVKRLGPIGRTSCPDTSDPWGID